MQLLGLVGEQCNFSFWLTPYIKFWNIRTLLIFTGHKNYMLNKAKDLVTYKSLWLPATVKTYTQKKIEKS